MSLILSLSINMQEKNMLRRTLFTIPSEIFNQILHTTYIYLLLYILS